MPWALPAIHVVASAISGFYYGRHMFVMVRQQTPPDASLAQMVFWLFNMPCLQVVNLLANPMPLTWQPQEYSRVWITQPVTLFVCTVVNTGVWIWIGSQLEETGGRVSWWRWALAVAGAGIAVGILFHTRTLDPQVIPFIAWSMLVAAWAIRPAFAPYPQQQN